VKPLSDHRCVLRGFQAKAVQMQRQFLLNGEIEAMPLRFETLDVLALFPLLPSAFRIMQQMIAHASANHDDPFVHR